MAIHSGETPFTCFYCSYASNRKNNLMTHCIKKHEMDVDEFKAKARGIFTDKPRGRPRRFRGGELGGSSTVQKDSVSNVQ